MTRVLQLLVIIAPLVTHARNDDFEETIVSVLTQGLFYNYHQVQMKRTGNVMFIRKIVTVSFDVTKFKPIYK